MTVDIVDEFIQTVAIHDYKMEVKVAKDKFSTHLYQEGACLIFFAARYQLIFIKQVLQWKSNVWLTYVCDLVCTAAQQVRTMTDCDKNVSF